MAIASFAILAVLLIVAAFLLGRNLGNKTAESARAAERLEAERRLHEETQRATRTESQAQSALVERDRLLGEVESLRTELAGAQRGWSESRSGLAAAEAAARTRGEQLQELRERLHAAELRGEKLQTELRETAAALEGARTQNETEATEAGKRLKLVMEAEEKLGNQFKVLAAEIFKEKSERFREESEAGLGNLLNPLKERMGEFQQKVEALQRDGVIGRTELREQLGNLKMLNEQLSAEAGNLARALKGSSKTQGDWGEVLLARMLESAGLRAGKEYRVQQSLTTEEGRQMRPDIVLELPGDKHLVIDSKVSLNSYTEYCSCEDEASRKRLLDRHARALRTHVEGLSKKAYQAMHGLSSIDFVVMFVPIEPAYLLAVAHDETLWQHAWERDVLLVSPGTLFPVIRTVAHIWRQERQTRNVEEIVRQAGGLYDKVAVFAETFMDVGKRIDMAKGSYDKAYGQLKNGNGSVVSRIEKMQRLGLTTTKKMPTALASGEEDAQLEDITDSLYGAESG